MQFYCIYQCTSTKIKLELKKNILNFGYAINYKYEGMLAHSFDRFYVVTKFILPSIRDLNFSKLNYDNTCVYLDNNNICDAETKKHMLYLIMFCKKIEPFVIYYKRLIKSRNNTAHNILINEIDLILLYNVLLLINHYTGNITTKCHNESMSDNRDLTGIFHQKNFFTSCKHCIRF